MKPYVNDEPTYPPPSPSGGRRVRPRIAGLPPGPVEDMIEDLEAYGVTIERICSEDEPGRMSELDTADDEPKPRRRRLRRYFQNGHWYVR